MGKNRIKVLGLFALCTGILLCWVYPAHPAQVVIQSEDQFRFARDLMERGEYDRAVSEFERFLHFFPDDRYCPKARYLMGLCHLKGHHYERAREIFFAITRTEPRSAYAGRAMLMIGESYYRQGHFGEAERYFGRAIKNYDSSRLKNAALYRLGWSRMRANRWRNASDIFKRVEKDSAFYESSQELAVKGLEGESLPQKDPALAGTLAALLPGAGHAYVSRYKDATVAFLLNGLFVWAAIEAFDQDHDVLGGMLAFLELGWYTGNIYSAVNATHKHNRKVRDDFRNKLKDRFDLRLSSWGKGQVGLALSIQF